MDDFDFDLSAKRHRTSKTVIVAELKRFAGTVDPPYSAAQFKRSNPAVSIDTVVRMYGSFVAACAAAGLETTAMKREFSDDDLLEYFETLIKWRRDKGYTSVVPSITDFRNYRKEGGQGISHDTFTRRFGDYRKFLTRYQAYRRQTLSRQELIEKSKAGTKPQRQALSPRVYAETLHRFGNRCTSCGRHASELEPGERLEIDHILPVAQGGTNDIDNLTIKCSRENRGKGARFVG